MRIATTLALLSLSLTGCPSGEDSESGGPADADVDADADGDTDPPPECESGCDCAQACDRDLACNPYSDRGYCQGTCGCMSSLATGALGPDLIDCLSRRPCDSGDPVADCSRFVTNDGENRTPAQAAYNERCGPFGDCLSCGAAWILSDETIAVLDPCLNLASCKEVLPCMEAALGGLCPGGDSDTDTDTDTDTGTDTDTDTGTDTNTGSDTGSDTDTGTDTDTDTGT